MRTALKWTARLLGVVLLLIVIATVATYIIGGSRFGKIYQAQTATLEIRSDSATIARGEHLANINGCKDCHGADLSGGILIDAPPFRVTAANLTAGEGGIGGAYDAVDFDRALRHGVAKSGRALQIMPSGAYHHLSDEDAAAIIAYVQQAPPVDKVLPPTELRPLGRGLAGAGALALAYEVRTEPARSEPAPPVGPTAEYGEYLASVTCGHCHGSSMQGAQPSIPDSPFAPDLRAAGQWSLDEFKHALRTGERPNGREPLNPEFMPYSITMKMTDAELEALYAYLGSLIGA